MDNNFLQFISNLGQKILPAFDYLWNIMMIYRKSMHAVGDRIVSERNT